MGWWKSGNGKDIIGDSPIDRILYSLRHLAYLCNDSSQPKPTLEALLSTVGASLMDRTELLLTDPENVPVTPVVKVLMRNGNVISAFPDIKVLGPKTVSLFWLTFEDIAADYLSSELERKPKLSEVLTCLAFVLRVEGTQYLEGVPEEMDIDRILMSER
jgi:hypothetical protein